MKLFNCGLQEAKKKFKNRKIIFFGCGSWISVISYTELMELKNQFSYAVDNNLKLRQVFIEDICLPVYQPNKLLEEKECVVVLSSPVYMYEMYCQLVEMDLDDSIYCVAFPFMQMVTPNTVDSILLKKVTDSNGKSKIPKVVHSFWFSGEKKPESYQRCIDTWHKVLKDYEIIEWNKSNYDYHKHPFVERAVELKAWAFAADYARLDVLNEYGGIYLDADVEVFKSFESLLDNDAILSFSNHIMVDLAVMGARKGNGLIKQLMELYDKAELPTERKEFSKYFQPSFIRKTLVDAGICMNGSLQVVDDATVFPCSFFMGLDHVLFSDLKKTENTYCVHYDNFGWSFSTENKQEKKKRDNNALWRLIENV